MTAQRSTSERLAELQRTFDGSFAAPAVAHDDALEGALAVRAGDGRLAVRLEDLAAVEACRRIVPLPVDLPGHLGVAGVRGQLVAAYDLAALLGLRGPTAAAEAAPPRWLLLCAGAPELGLAIDEVEGYLRFSRADLRSGDGGGLGEHVREALRHGAVLRGLVDVPSLAAAVARRARGGLSPSKEQE